MIKVFHAAGLALAMMAGSAAPALAQPYFIDFTGSDSSGGLLSGTAAVSQQGSLVSVLAFNANFSNLSQEGASANSATFGLGDVADAYWYLSGNPNGTGSTTFSFDLSGTENGLTGSSDYYDSVYLTDGSWGNYFTTQVTSFSVPEPGSLMLLGAGVIGLSLAGRRRGAATDLAAWHRG